MALNISLSCLKGVQLRAVCEWVWEGTNRIMADPLGPKYAVIPRDTNAIVSGLQEGCRQATGGNQGGLQPQLVRFLSQLISLACASAPVPSCTSNAREPVLVR